MAFSAVNAEVRRLLRGIPVPLGSLNAANQAVAFSVSPVRDDGLRYLVISVAGLSGTNTGALEATLDGSSWINIPALASDVGPAVGADTPASLASRYNIAGLPGAVFRFGLTAYGSGTGLVTALVS